jgi:hypothetical protein
MRPGMPDLPEPREKFEKQLKNAHSSLGLIFVLSTINAVLLLAGTEYSFLFSSFTAQLALQFGSEFGERMYVVGVVITVAILAFLAISWLGSNKHHGFYIAAFVFMLIDTLIMFFFVIMYLVGGESDSIGGMLLEVLFHVWAAVSLLMGTIASSKLKNLPPPAEEIPFVPAQYTQFDASGNPIAYQPAPPIDGTQYQSAPPPLDGTQYPPAPPPVFGEGYKSPFDDNDPTAPPAL